MVLFQKENKSLSQQDYEAKYSEFFMKKSPKNNDIELLINIKVDLLTSITQLRKDDNVIIRNVDEYENLEIMLINCLDFYKKELKFNENLYQLLIKTNFYNLEQFSLNQNTCSLEIEFFSSNENKNVTMSGSDSMIVLKDTLSTIVLKDVDFSKSTVLDPLNSDRSLKISSKKSKSLAISGIIHNLESKEELISEKEQLILEKKKSKNTSSSIPKIKKISKSQILPEASPSEISNSVNKDENESIVRTVYNNSVTIPKKKKTKIKKHPKNYPYTPPFSPPSENFNSCHKNESNNDDSYENKASNYLSQNFEMISERKNLGNKRTSVKLSHIHKKKKLKGNRKRSFEKDEQKTNPGKIIVNRLDLDLLAKAEIFFEFLDRYLFFVIIPIKFCYDNIGVLVTIAKILEIQFMKIFKQLTRKFFGGLLALLMKGSQICYKVITILVQSTISPTSNYRSLIIRIFGWTFIAYLTVGMCVLTCFIYVISFSNPEQPEFNLVQLKSELYSFIDVITKCTESHQKIMSHLIPIQSIIDIYTLCRTINSNRSEYEDCQKLQSLFRNSHENALISQQNMHISFLDYWQSNVLSKKYMERYVPESNEWIFFQYDSSPNREKSNYHKIFWNKKKVFFNRIWNYPNRDQNLSMKITGYGYDDCEDAPPTAIYCGLIGEGQILFSNGDTYEGQIVRNRAHGYGNYLWAPKQAYNSALGTEFRRYMGEYVGNFHINKMRGYGRLTKIDQTTVKGKFMSSGCNCAPSMKDIKLNDNYSVVINYPNTAKGISEDMNNMMATRKLYSGYIRNYDSTYDYLHGQGYLKFKEGLGYSGYFWKDNALGKGKVEIETGDWVIGEIYNNQQQGYGQKYGHKFGYLYQGNYVNGLRDGFAKESYNSEGTTYYEGYFKNDKKHGHGYQVDHGRGYYDGHWLEGERNGIGRQVYKDIFEYYGGWCNNQKCSKGRQIDYKEKSQYEGFWKGDFKHGIGMTKHGIGKTITAWTQTRTFFGTYKDGKRNGVGKMTNTREGYVYMGNYVSDVFHDKGIYITGSTVYVGEFHNKLRQGYDECYCENGIVYIGRWRDDKRVGQHFVRYDPEQCKLIIDNHHKQLQRPEWELVNGYFPFISEEARNTYQSKQILITDYKDIYINKMIDGLELIKRYDEFHYKLTAALWGIPKIKSYKGPSKWETEQENAPKYKDIYASEASTLCFVNFERGVYNGNVQIHYNGSGLIYSGDAFLDKNANCRRKGYGTEYNMSHEKFALSGMIKNNGFKEINRNYVAGVKYYGTFYVDPINKRGIFNQIYMNPNISFDCRKIMFENLWTKGLNLNYFHDTLFHNKDIRGLFDYNESGRAPTMKMRCCHINHWEHDHNKTERRKAIMMFRRHYKSYEPVDKQQMVNLDKSSEHYLNGLCYNINNKYDWENDLYPSSNRINMLNTNGENEFTMVLRAAYGYDSKELMQEDVKYLKKIDATGHFDFSER